MSWLEEEMENKISVLTAGVKYDLATKQMVAAQCLRSAYDGGFKDGAGELEVTRALLRDAAVKIGELSQTVDLLTNCSAPGGVVVEPPAARPVERRDGAWTATEKRRLPILPVRLEDASRGEQRTGFTVQRAYPDDGASLGVDLADLAHNESVGFGDGVSYYLLYTVEEPDREMSTERRPAGGPCEPSDKPWPAVGTRVRSRRDFAGVPEGTEGVVDYDYGSGVWVAWDQPHRPLPPGYEKWSGKPQAAHGEPLRDGFDKETELDMLEEVS